MDVVKLRTGPALAPVKFAGFDAVRALAALGVVLLHACVPYLRYPMPGLAWPVRDQTSNAVDILFWGIEIFIMPLFLVMAGILAWRTLDRRGPGEVVKSRGKRLLLPLLFGILVVLPLDLYAWILGWVSEGLVAPVKLKSMKFDGELGRDLWGLSHLWFLLYLFLYVCCAAGACWLIRRHNAARRYLPSTLVSAIVLFAIGVVTLMVSPEVVWGFQHSFFPVLSKWLYSGTFFAGGVLIARSDPDLSVLRRSFSKLAVPTMVLLAFAIAMGRWHLAGAESQTADVLLAVITTASAWCTALCILSLATARIKRIPIPMQYLAAASFWIYVVHHPFLGLIHTDLKWLMPTTMPGVKTALAFSMAVGFCLLMYEGLIRKSRLGRWLGFAWEFPTRSPDSALPTISIEESATEPQVRRAA